MNQFYYIANDQILPYSYEVLKKRNWYNYQFNRLDKKHKLQFMSKTELSSSQLEEEFKTTIEQENLYASA